MSWILTAAVLTNKSPSSEHEDPGVLYKPPPSLALHQVPTVLLNACKAAGRRLPYRIHPFIVEPPPEQIQGGKFTVRLQRDEFRPLQWNIKSFSDWIAEDQRQLKWIGEDYGYFQAYKERRRLQAEECSRFFDSTWQRLRYQDWNGGLLEEQDEALLRSWAE